MAVSATSNLEATGSDRGHAFIQSILNQRVSLDGSDSVSPFLSTLRSQAEARLAELNIPTSRDEDWKYTDLSPLLKYDFRSSQALSLTDPHSLQQVQWSETQSSQIVFVNGSYNPELSNTSAIGETIKPHLLSGLAPELVSNYLQKLAGDDVFTLLNTACLSEATVLLVPKGSVIASPIHLIHITDSQAGALLTSPRCLVWAGANSSVSIIEDYVGLGQGSYFTNAVTEIWLDPNAQVTHTKVQREGSGAFHIAKTAVHQARDSRYTCHAVGLGGSLSRHTFELVQGDEQADTTWNGLTVCTGQQLADTHTTIDHQVPHGTSRQIHKCVVSERAHGVFNGKVLVQSSAPFTQAEQSSRNLLLSPKSRVDAKPQLEIFNDNVKCSHGVTISELETNEIFYLQSRGIDEKQARDLLTVAFTSEVIQKLPLASMKSYFKQVVRTALEPITAELDSGS